MRARRTSAEGEELRAWIRQAGLRCTPARVAVLRELHHSTRPLTHAEITSTLAPAGIDRATVYRNLVDLVAADLLSRVDLGDHVWRFELRADGRHDARQHPHFICTECGEVSCLVGVKVAIKPASGARRRAVGKVTEVLLKGRCHRCS